MKLTFEIIQPPARGTQPIRVGVLTPRQLRDRSANMLGAAITSGRVTRKPCCICGAEKSQAHHEDYTLPHLITWVCQSHHSARHAEIRRGISTAIPKLVIAKAKAALEFHSSFKPNPKPKKAA